MAEIVDDVESVQLDNLRDFYWNEKPSLDSAVSILEKLGFKLSLKHEKCSIPSETTE